MNDQEEITEFFNDGEEECTNSENYELRLVVLIENTSCIEDVIPEHGLSVYIEFDGKTGLYDTGATGQVLENSEELYLDLSELDWIALSHGHYDHTGGLTTILENNPKKIPVYAGKNAFEPKYAKRDNGVIESIGCPTSKTEIEEMAAFVTEVRGKTEISENVFLVGPAPLNESYEHPSRYMVIKNKEGEYVSDLLEDERTLVIKTSKGIVVITGCAHRGSVNITKNIMTLFPNEKLLLVIGGFHLGKTDDESIMKRINAFSEMDLGGIGLCHCTGAKACNIFKKELGDTCFIAPAGSEIVL